MFIEDKDLAFNLTLEVLEGCGYSCQDCAIDKTGLTTITSVESESNLILLVDDFLARGFRLHELTIGPTDIISSSSGIATLETTLVKELAKRYDSLTVSLALLFDRGLVEFGKAVNRLMSGKRFRLIVPCTLKNAGNDKFLALVRERIDIIKTQLTDVEFKLVYLTINVVNDSATEFSLETNRIAHDIDFGVPKLIEYVFPHGRKGFDNLLNVSEFKKDLGLYVDGLHRCVDTDMFRYIIPTVSDSLEVTLRNDQLYYTPVLMEKLPFFVDTLRYSKPWSTEAIIGIKETQYYDNLIRYSNHSTCGDCCFIDNCARGDVHLIMNQLDLTECPIKMKNRWDLCPSTEPVSET